MLGAVPAVPKLMAQSRSIPERLVMRPGRQIGRQGARLWQRSLRWAAVQRNSDLLLSNELSLLF